MKFIMVGANAGKSIKIGTFQFTDGAFVMPGSPDKLGSLIKYLATFGAFPYPSDEYNDAVAFLETLKKEKQVGTGQVLQGQQRSPASGLQANVAPAGEASGKGTTDVAPVSTGPVAEGDGTEAGRMDGGQALDPKAVKVLEAIKALNPEVPEQWNDEGLPMTSVVAELSGVPDVSRADISNAMPGWNRDKAMKVMVDNL